jgi:TP901 family phage tail tape measure protein
MAKSFNLTAQINLQGPANLKPVVDNIKKQLSGINTNVNLSIDSKAAKNIDVINKRLQTMNSILVQARNNTNSLNASLSSMGNSLGSVSRVGSTTTKAIQQTGNAAKTTASAIKQAGTEMQEFGKQSALAIRRFAAFSVVSTAVYGLVRAIDSGVKAFIDFDRQVIKLQQVTGKGSVGIASLEKEITKLATTLGVSSESLIEVASTLAQAGLSAEETRIALAALAKTELAPSFDNLTDTTEGAIAAIRQFGLQASELEGVLGSINAVAAAFAVESRDIIAAIQRTGGVFAAASKGVSEGSDALNEFIAIFTSVRQTTRESAETIATGLRTIFTRIQRQSTVDALKELGIELRDASGQFVGAYEAVRRLSEGLSKLDPRSAEFAKISEELGGFRQIGKVIPLIQQFAVAQEALKVAQKGQSSLSDAQVIAQKSLANQIAKVREQFLALVREVGKSSAFQGFFKIVVGLTSGLISLAGAFKPILPLLGIIGAFFGINAGSKVLNGCTTLVGILISLVIGFLIGFAWFSIVISSGPSGPKLLFFGADGGEPICSRPSKQTFKCKVYRNGEVIHTT